MDIWTSVSISHKGKIRKVNEDSFISRDDQGFWAVADGMGGHAAGDYASQQIVQRFSQMEFTDKGMHLVADYIDDNMIELDDALKVYAEENKVGAVGSTVIALLLNQNNVGLAYWVGDSRLYQYRDGELNCISTDHSLVQELVDIGELTLEEAEMYPSKNIITRAIGANNHVCSEISLIDYRKGDKFLLCSDGLTNELSDNEIISLINKPNTALEDIGNELLSASLKKTAADNITLILVEINESNTD